MSLPAANAFIREVGDLYDRFKRFPAEGFEAAEVFIEREPLQGLTLRGAVDAVFVDSEIGTRLIDWKTGQIGRADEQLSFYGLLWFLGWLGLLLRQVTPRGVLVANFVAFAVPTSTGGSVGIYELAGKSALTLFFGWGAERALTIVVLFHAGATGASGGFLGVSLFLTAQRNFSRAVML